MFRSLQAMGKLYGRNHCSMNFIERLNARTLAAVHFIFQTRLLRFFAYFIDLLCLCTGDKHLLFQN
jgi:hypothetical protein